MSTTKAFKDCRGWTEKILYPRTHTHSQTHTLTQTHTYAHTYTHSQSHTRTRTHTHTHAHTHEPAHIHRHTRTHRHTHIHTHTQTHMQDEFYEQPGLGDIVTVKTVHHGDRAVKVDQKKPRKPGTGHLPCMFMHTGYQGKERGKVRKIFRWLLRAVKAYQQKYASLG